MINHAGRVVLISGLLFAVTAMLGEDSKHSNAPPGAVVAALGCLVATDFIGDNLTELQLTRGSGAWIRYHIGSIPGTEPTPGEYYIAVYSMDGLRGWLFLADKDLHGRFVPVRNAYRVTKEGRQWRADEGNGGLGTYRAMSKFATRLAMTPRYRVKLVPRTQGCAPPDE